MTEAEWLAATHAYQMIYHKTCRSNRKRRLLSCACARRVLPFLDDDRFPAALDVSERYADGLATDADLKAAGRSVKKASKDMVKRNSLEHQHCAANSVELTLAKEFMGFKMAVEVAAHACGAKARPDWDEGIAAEEKIQCALTRDIFQNPFRPVQLENSWLAWNGGTVVHLAQVIYEERAFDRLPILADALEDAGCTEQAILEHCRGGTEHVRGCWVVDLLTDRE